MDEHRMLHQQENRGEAIMLDIDAWSQIKDLSSKGWGIRKIARELDIDRNTVRKVLRQKLFQGYKQRSEKTSILQQWKEYIEHRACHVDFNATRLYHEVVDQGYTGSYGTVRDFVRPLRAQFKLVENAFVRFETTPGKQAQVDWGSKTVLLGGIEKRIHIFVMILGYSRAIYVEFTLDEKLDTLLKCHQHAFEWFDGCTEEILYDNMKTVVIDRQGGNIQYHPKFTDFAALHGFTPKLCQPARPQTKGKVESGVKYVKKSFLTGSSFDTLEQMNTMVLKWIRNVADERIHGTTYRKPSEAFKEEGLKPFHPNALWGETVMRSAHKDCMISFRANKYTIPWQYAGKEVEVRTEGSDKLVILHNDKVIAEHTLLEGRHQVSFKREHFINIYRKQQNDAAIDEVQVRSLDFYEALAQGGAF